jgi:uncharacterized repeat protein (TIGR03803 family)
MLIAAVLTAAGCGGGTSGGAPSSGGGTSTGGTTSNPTLVSIDATPNNPTIEVGTQVRLTITGHLSDGTSTSSLQPPYFTSSQPAVAAVDSAGNVSALAVGSTTITVTDTTFTTTATITVTPGLAAVTYLYTFGSVPADGVQPANLIQASDGNFYGTAMDGGTGTAPCLGTQGSCGAIFSVSAIGVESVLYSFGANSSDGFWPTELIQARDGNFYGTTVDGGNFGVGTFFKMTPQGSVTILYSFGASASDGITPLVLLEGPDGNFYGITSTGGANSCVQTPGGTNNCGTVFKITPSGVETILYSFGANTSDGVEPNGLMLANDGNLYGTTGTGGANACGSLMLPYDCGTVFKLTLDGTESILFSFGGDPLNGSSPHGQAPQGVLLQASDGSLYGATSGGGANGLNCGIVYKMTLDGTQSVLYSFGSSTGDGCYPSSLIQASDGNFYGTTGSGGAFGGDLMGTAFKITPFGTETVLYSFGPLDLGPSQPHGLLQGIDGNFYGLTTYTTSGFGSLFKLSLTH